MKKSSACDSTPLAQDAVRELFQRKAHRWSDKYRTALRHRLDLFCDELATIRPRPEQVLDYGCGSGIYLCRLASEGHQMTGIDFSPAMIQQCRHNLQEACQTAQLFCGRLEQFSCQPATFDAIICSSVVEYLQEPEPVLKRLAGLLKQEGVILMTVPNRHSWRKIRQRVVRGLLPLARPLERIAKVRDYAEFLRLSTTYSPERVAQLADTCQLNVHKWFYFDPLQGTRSTNDKRSGETLFVVLGKLSHVTPSVLRS